jgi:hypothetical protein
MAALNTDKLKKLSRRWVGQIGSGGVSDATVTTIPLASTTNLPTDTAVVATIDRVDASGTATSPLEETVIGVVSGSNLVTCTRGVEGTAQAHSAGAVVEILVTAKGWNDIVDHLLVEHNQDGTHAKVTGLTNNTAISQKDFAGTTRAIAMLNSNNVLEIGVSGATAKKNIYLTDSGAADAYVVTCSPAPIAYATGMEITFKATNANTTAATLNVNSLGAKTIKRYGTTDLSAGDIAAGQVITVIYDGTNFLLKNWAQGSATASILTTTQFAPQGFLLNGKISVTVSSNNITVAIKGMDGNDPSSSNKVYCRIGDTVRTISAALSVTKNAGTNWFGSGATKLATKEIDYFVYLGYNATDGVLIGFARIPTARQYSDFSSTSTNERYCAISTITTAASSDYYELIGRFAATLSATASFNWSVPAYTALNLIQRPIFETRWLIYAPTYTGFSSSPTGGTDRYRISGNMVHLKHAASSLGTSNAANFLQDLPIVSGASVGQETFAVEGWDNSSLQTSPLLLTISPSATQMTFGKSLTSAGGFTTSGTKEANYSCFYEID